MNNFDLKLLISNLDGWLRGLAEINGEAFEYRGGACSIKLEDQKNLDISFQEYLRKETEYNKKNYKEIDWPTYHLNNWVEINPWVGVLEEALGDLLLPNPLNQKENIDSEKVGNIKARVAWHVMEIVMLITNDFSNESIYSVDYEREKYSKGVFYVIPLNGDFLILDFGYMLPDTIENKNIL